MPTQAGLAKLGERDVVRVYRRWAPLYDATFGFLVDKGVRQAAARANLFSGKLLDVGVGTGLALPYYGTQLEVTGIDLSPDMLEIARKRAARLGKTNVKALLQMDATRTPFSDSSFDVLTALFVMTVVPEPKLVMREMARLLKPDGRILIVSHFKTGRGLTGMLERALARQADQLGWRPDFPIESILIDDVLELVSIRPAGPMGFFSLVEFKRK